MSHSPMDDVARVLLDSIWRVWEGHPPPHDPAGDRIFCRHVSVGTDDDGWRGWSLMAVLRPGGVQWLCEERWEMIEEALAAGECGGTISGPRLRLQWARSRGDGPDVS